MRRPTPGAIVALGIAAIALFVYGSSLYPDVPGGDSGELIGAVATGGVIHPPGYPLYALLGKLFVRLPFGTVAWRLNFLSAFCDAAAAGVLSYAASRWSRSLWAGIASGALFAFSPGVWQYAIVAEVFALNNLLVATLILLAVLYDEADGDVKTRRKLALVIALVAGLGLSNHQTSLFVSAPIVLWVFLSEPRELLKPREIGRALALFGVGLSPYLYLPLAARNRSAISWGAADTWSGFWTHVLRSEYGTFRLAPPGVGGETLAAATATAWGHHLYDQIGWWGIALAVVGAYVSFREGREKGLGFGVVALVPPLLSVAMIALLGNLPVTVPLYREIVSRFWEQPELFFCAWCGIGIAAIGRRLTDGGIAAAACGAGLLQVGLHSSAADRHGNHLVRIYGAEILRAAPPGALLVTKGDLITSTVRYLQAVEGQRPDVRVVDQELLAFPWARPLLLAAHPELSLPGARYAPGPDGFSMKQLLDANIARSPVAICGGIRPGDTTADATYARWPLGLCESVHPVSEAMDASAWIRESEAALPRIDFADEARPPGSWEEIVWGDYWEVRHTRAAELLTLAGHDESRRPYIALAITILEEILRGNPGAPPHVRKTLAMALGRLGLDTPEQKRRAAEAWRSYVAVAPKDDPQLPAIEAELRRLRQEASQSR